MSSDEAYSSFLEQANQETGASNASAQSTSAATKAVDTDVPVSLQKVEQYYTSDADEPFEPVSLKWSGSNMPSEGTYMTPDLAILCQITSRTMSPRGADIEILDEFKDLVDHKSEVSTLSTQEFDPKGQYKEVLQAVEEAGDGKARVFRVHHGSTRAEYYVVGLHRKGKKVVGLKAKAVES